MFTHLQAGEKAKLKALHAIRLAYAEKPYRSVAVLEDSVALYRSLLTDEGVFSDLRKNEQEMVSNDYANQIGKQGRISALTNKAFSRIWMVAETYRNKSVSSSDPEVRKLFKAILHYGQLENKRLNVSTRWHASCFALPVASTHIYFSLFDIMQRIEKGQVSDPLFIGSHKMLGEVSRQCWTVPARKDSTDGNEISVERFRKHTWWVGGNATAYRPLLAAAAQLSSIPMADVVGEVAVRSISSVSQTTLAEDFWVEGITADGAGWGHGMQCLVWGYPLHGTLGSLGILQLMKDYPLTLELQDMQIETLLNYLRGSSFFYYKGYVPPVVDRGNMNRLERPYPGRTGNKATAYRYPIPSVEMVRFLMEYFPHELKPETKAEFKQFLREAPGFQMAMEGKWHKHYFGSRYFFNNDKIIKKNDDYYLLINMASSRVSGLESARTIAAALNIFTCDGLTLFFRDGNEYQRVMGAFNLRAWAGTTSRLSSEPLVPIENWSGYNSRHPFAAGATSGGNSFAGGFVFEKNNHLWQKGNKKHNPYADPNPAAFGVKAYKSYFMFDDVLLAMGCGIENKMPELNGDIITTIDQTELKADFEKGETIRNNRFFYQVMGEHTDGTLELEYGKKKTGWQKMCIENKLPETEENIFHLYINHGHNVKNASYAYTVACSEEARSQTPLILANSTDIQAAESYDRNKIGIVCYTSGATVNTSIGYIRTSAPCALLLELTGNAALLSVTDGLMDANLKEIVIDTSIPLKGKDIHKISDGKYQIRVGMKTGRNTGEPVLIKALADL